VPVGGVEEDLDRTIRRGVLQRIREQVSSTRST
jgi:hypothetical protein